MIFLQISGENRMTAVDRRDNYRNSCEWFCVIKNKYAILFQLSGHNRNICYTFITNYVTKRHFLHICFFFTSLHPLHLLRYSFVDNTFQS